MVSVCISLMPDDVERLFMYLPGRKVYSDCSPTCKLGYLPFYHGVGSRYKSFMSCMICKYSFLILVIVFLLS